MKIEIFHAELTGARLSTESEMTLANHVTWQLDDNAESVTIFFQPAHMMPKLRWNNFLINDWLAGIDFDWEQGCLTLKTGQDFVSRYKSRDIDGRISSLGANSTNDFVLDRAVGIVKHTDLVNKLNKLINEKRTSN